jgi:hypothetical protein
MKALRDAPAMTALHGDHAQAALVAAAAQD